MAKRYTDTEIWNKSWFQNLPPRLKLFWKYLYENCDNAGIWDTNFMQASFQIGEKVTDDDLKCFGDRIELLPDGKYWLTSFVHFQYGMLKPLSPPHKSAIDKLLKYGLLDRVSKGLSKGIETVKDIYKDIDKDKDKDIDIPERLAKLSGFNLAWQDFIMYRVEIGKPMTYISKKRTLMFLEKYEFPVELIDYGIHNKWRGLQWGLPENVLQKLREKRRDIERTIKTKSCRWCGKEKKLKELEQHENSCEDRPSEDPQKLSELNKEVNKLSTKFRIPKEKKL